MYNLEVLTLDVHTLVWDMTEAVCHDTAVMAACCSTTTCCESPVNLSTSDVDFSIVVMLKQLIDQSCVEVSSHSVATFGRDIDFGLQISPDWPHCRPGLHAVRITKDSAGEVQDTLEDIYRLCAHVEFDSAAFTSATIQRGRAIDEDHAVESLLCEIVNDVLAHRRIRRRLRQRHIDSIEDDLLLGDLAAPTKLAGKSLSVESSGHVTSAPSSAYPLADRNYRPPASQRHPERSTTTDEAPSGFDEDCVNPHDAQSGSDEAVSSDLGLCPAAIFNCLVPLDDATSNTHVSDRCSAVNAEKLSSRLARRLEDRASALAKLKSPYTRLQCRKSSIEVADAFRKDDAVIEALPSSPVEPSESPSVSQLRKPFRKHVLAVKDAVQPLSYDRPQDPTHGSDSSNEEDVGVRKYHNSHDTTAMRKKFAAPKVSLRRTATIIPSIADDMDDHLVAPAGSHGQVLETPSQSSVVIRTKKPLITILKKAVPCTLESLRPDLPDDVTTKTNGAAEDDEHHSPKRRKKDSPGKVSLPVLKSLADTVNKTIWQPQDHAWHQNIGWETASGTKIDIKHDPALAAEWNAPVSSSLGENRHQPSTPIRSRKLPLRIAEEADAEYKTLVNEHLVLQKQVNEIKEHVKEAESALKCETRQEEPRLRELICKWRGVAQLACEEIFASTKDRIDRAGGFHEWQKSQEWSRWNDHHNKQTEDDPYGLTSEEKEAMGIGEEDFSLHHLLSTMGIPAALIGWDSDLCCWR